MPKDAPTLDTVVPEDIKLKEVEETTPENNTPAEPQETATPADTTTESTKPEDTDGETLETSKSEEKTKISEDDFNTFLNESTNGKVKSQKDIDELLKPKEPQKLEFSSNIVEKLNEHVQNGGTEKEFLSLYTMDLDNMDEVDLLHAKFIKDNPNLSYSEADTLFEQEMTEKYKLGKTDDEEEEVNEKEIEIAGIKLKRDSDIAKKEFTELKEKITKIPENKQEEKDKLKNNQIKWASDVDKLYEKETLEIPFNDKEGKPLKDKFNFKIEDKNIVERTKDLGKFWELFVDKDHKPLTEKLKLVQTFASNPDKFMQSIFDFGINKGIENTMGSKELSPETPTDNTKLSDSTHEDKIAKGLLEAMEKENI